MKGENRSLCSRRQTWTFYLFGLGSLLWLLLRSGTNPRRLAYPCQRAALASGMGSVGYLASLLGSAHLYRRLKRAATLTGIGSLVVLLLLGPVLVGSNVLATSIHADPSDRAPSGRSLDLPAWTSPTAVSNVFAVSNVPVPECSLDGGSLPSTPPCSNPTYALRDAGVDSLVAEMETRGDYFYRTTAHPAGIVGADDVVVIKINNQWGGQGDGSGYGRLSTNTDVLKGLIWRVLQHPDGFSGEVIVAENTQDVLLNWDTTPANAQDQNQSYQDVVDAFQGLGYGVSLFTWDTLGDNLISGGSVGGAGYPTGEYARGNYDDAYILLEDPAGTGANELSYPKFRTAGGHYVSMRYGVWNGSSYDADRLTFINVPVLKRHGMAGSTIAWKNLVGFVTIRAHNARYGSWDLMHDYFWGYTGGTNRNYGLIGREMALIRGPDLNVVDAIWVGIDDNTSGRASRQDILVASTDPFAVDWYASEYVLRPVAAWPEDASAARAGTFRDATRTNQNAAASVWPGGSYPYIDLLDGYDGDTPSADERNQMNAYVVGTLPATSTPTATATATADGATATSTATPSATATATSTATTTATATPTATRPSGGTETMIFQQGVSPDPSYAGTTDATITTFDGNTYANLGGLDDLEVGEEGDADMFRFLVRFELVRNDVSPSRSAASAGWLPADIQINEAWLELRAYDFEYDADPQDAVVHRVLEEWVEGDGWDLWADGRDEGVTWSTARPGVPWASPGGDFDPAEMDRVTVPSNPDGWYRWDVTEAVRAWVNGTASNYGLLLEPEDAPWTFHVFRSSEYSIPTMRPRLVITYRPSCSADVHPDGIVDVEDIQTVTAWWHEDGFPPKVDLNHDEVVDILDIMAVAARWGEACGGGTGTATSTATATATASPTATATATATSTATGSVTPTATATETGEAGTLNVSLTVRETAGAARSDEPVTSGVPIPRDLELTDLSTLRLLDDGGDPVPAQFTPLARWGGAPDDVSKPVRWLLLDFQANVLANSTATYRLVNSGGATPAFPTLTVTDGADAVTVDIGAAQFSISKTDGNLTAPNLTAPLLGRARSGSTDYTTAGPVTVEVALSSPMRASVHVKGAYRGAGGTPLLDYTSRYWFYAGQSAIRLFHTVENNTPCPLDESGQLTCHDIGSSGSVSFTDVSLVLPSALTGPLTYQAGGEGAPVAGTLIDDLLLYQDSSGTDNWDHYPTMTDWEGDPLDTRPRMQSYVSFRGYRTTMGGTTVDSGDQAAGWLNITGTEGTWGVAVRDFWQNFPKALRASPDGIVEIGLFPDEFGPADYAFNLRAGEHKTHELWLSPAVAGLLTAPPLFAQAPADWYIQSGAIPFLAARDFTDWPDHENYIDYQLDTAPTYQEWMDWFPNLFAAIEGTDFYGIFDYADWPLDYEGYSVSPLNPKYHNDYGMWLQWLRGGDARWFDLAEAGNRHFADVDILHNLHTPRHWGDGIAFGHSYHDEEGFDNPHRNYGGSHPDTAYGVSGLLTTYYLTGYEKAYDTALELADCIEYRLHNDSHLCSYFPDCSGEGYALEAANGLYENGSRPAANNLSIAVAAYRATADPRYLAVADALVDWARASEQPYIDGPIAGDGRMVKPWMLNMVLRALAHYLEMRDEFGLPDTYDAEGSFLSYADWLRTYAWIDLDPIDTGRRGAYPYEWWFDGRAANDDADVVNWLLLGADAMAYAHRLSGEADYLERATRLFRAGSRDPWYEGDANTYSATKETANSITWGHIFLHEWAAQPP